MFERTKSLSLSRPPSVRVYVIPDLFLHHISQKATAGAWEWHLRHSRGGFSTWPLLCTVIRFGGAAGPRPLSRFPPAWAVWSSHDQSRISKPTAFFLPPPFLACPTCTTESGSNYYPPQGERPKFLICEKWSSPCFLRLAEVCLLILNHSSFHWLHDQDKCLS